METIQDEEQFYSIQENNSFLYNVIFFVSKDCPACINYRPVQEKFYELWQSQAKTRNLVAFYVVNFGLQFKPLLKKFDIRSVPTIGVFFKGKLINFLYHRHFQFIQEWLMNEFPDKEENLNANMAMNAIIELRKTILSHLKGKTKHPLRSAFFQQLLKEYSNPDFSEMYILKQIPELFDHNSRKLKKILYQGKHLFQQQPDWAAWLQEMEKVNKNVPESKRIHFENVEKLSHHPKLRNFLIAKLFSFLLHRSDVIL